MIKAEAKTTETLPTFKAQHALFASFYCMQVNCFLLNCHSVLPRQQKPIGSNDKSLTGIQQTGRTLTFEY